MPHKKDPASPATTSVAWDVMTPRWYRVSSVLEGTETLRAVAPDFLPPHQGESLDSYEERRLGNVLLNLTELTLESWVGRPFREEVKKGDDIPEYIVPLLEDVDLIGNDMSVFSRNWFRDGVAKALSHVLVEFPRRLDGERTAADDLEAGVRPYWVHIMPEQVIFAHAEIINGKEELTHLRWTTTRSEMVGFAEKFIEQIRSATLMDIFDEITGEIRTVVQMEVYEFVVQSRKRKPEWVLVDIWDSEIDEIPLVTFYADREGFMVGKPPIQDLVDLNIRWWQSNSDQIAILTVTRFPILAASGVSDTSDLIVGPKFWLGMDAPNGRFYYVEHKGEAIGAGRQELLDLEEQMGHYGAGFLRRLPGNQTATARALDSVESNSPLQDVSIRFEDALGNVLRLTDKWMRLADSSRGDPDEADGGSATVITDFGPEEADQVYANLIMFARNDRAMSREQLVIEMKRIGALPDTFDEKANEKQLEEEIRERMAAVADLDPEAGEDPDPEPNNDPNPIENGE